MVETYFSITSMYLRLKISDRPRGLVGLNDVILLINFSIFMLKSFILFIPQSEHLLDNRGLLRPHLSSTFIYGILSIDNPIAICGFLFLDLLCPTISTSRIQLWVPFLGSGTTLLLCGSSWALMSAIISLLIQTTASPHSINRPNSLGPLFSKSRRLLFSHW